MTPPTPARCVSRNVTTTRYVYRWGKYRPAWKGRACTVLARGKLNSALVRFDNGERACVSRNALRKAVMR